MYCRKCGTKNEESSKFCINCGETLAEIKEEIVNNEIINGNNNINNYLVPAIISTLCCCLPFGVVSIVYAAKVNELIKSGNIAEAKKASDSAKKWCIASFVCGGILMIIWSVFGFLGAMMHG